MAILHDRVPPPAHRCVIERIVCGLDGSPRSADAVRAAIAVAAAAPQLTFVTVSGTPPEPGPVASLAERRALRWLEQAQATAATTGVSAATQLVHGTDVAGALIARAGSGALLVAGSHGTSRLAGAVLGSVAHALLHGATGPLLIARPGPTDDRPLRLLVAVDDSPTATDVVRCAGTIAGAAGGHVHLLHIAGHEYGAGMRHRLAELSTELIALTGAEPAVDVVPGTHVASCVADFARRRQASLVVVGRRGLTGLHALGAASGRLVQLAPCSVLVVPTPRPAI